ncbi:MULTISPECIES: DUF4054 domain-containing protein [unclassified Saccharibacter]|uniref:DUF4054 domain-containing protein n=1 Tax=unclassified Saccharibacter TaxID=2648722 RepID=UPI0013232F91|nr:MULTISPECIES: DUF4054 domain-containing protein [unclassified Saccharibacter]MXV35745.1 DUF4054 domain-containing protein [Saccharibacter sp. EH611]MXV58423.1 DUF4054 domain-containing protein [Saccharibacter sp. EH70]
MTAGVVEFSYTDWAAAFPDLAQSVNETQARMLFRQACRFLNNTAFSIVQDVEERQDLLWLLMAHLAQLGLNASGAGSTGTQGGVGRIASASRGSVSVSFDGAGLPSHAGWFTQTQYGLTYWQATAQYRQMRMTPGRPHPARIWP